MTTWAFVLRRLASTAAIVAPLGTFLYLAIYYLAEGLVGGQYWLTIVLTAPSIVFLGKYLLDGLHDGTLPVGRSVVSRAAQPFHYWSWIIWFGAMIALLACICLYAVTSLPWDDGLLQPVDFQHHAG